MKGKRFINYVGVWLLLVACSPSKKGKLIEVRDVEIPFFQPSASSSGVYKNAKGEEVLFFSSVGEHCCLEFYSYPGLKKIDSIPLESVPMIENGIDGIALGDNDSVRLMLSNVNTELLINAKGNVVEQKVFSSYKPTEIGSMQLSANFQTGQYIYQIGAEYYYIFMSGYTNWPPDTGSVVEHMKAYQQLQDGLPLLLMARVGDTSHTFMADTANLFARIGNTREWMVPKIFRHTVVNDKVAVYSDFSDNIFLFSGKDLHFEREVKLESDYTEIGVKPLEITVENTTRIGEILNDYRMKQGAIADIHPDLPNKRIFIVVMHTVPEETPKHLSWNKRPWSLFVMDLDFKKTDEIKMPPGVYNPYLFTIVSDGILLGYSEDNPNYKEGVLQYKLVRYESD